eukprot:GEMP01038151.1.p1 GENE.GEMP01038151.1~~GEMP01038151.1.p1  ORF type:complete len:509 (+),score=81.20 GEMP01038151.1:41-1528(+)
MMARVMLLLRALLADGQKPAGRKQRWIAYLGLLVRWVCAKWTLSLVTLNIAALCVVEWVRYRRFIRRCALLQVRRREDGLSMDMNFLRFFHKVSTKNCTATRDCLSVENLARFGHLTRQSVEAMMLGSLGFPFKHVTEEQYQLVSEICANMCSLANVAVGQLPTDPAERSTYITEMLRPQVLLGFGSMRMKPFFKPLPVYLYYRYTSLLFRNALKLLTFRDTWRPTPEGEIGFWYNAAFVRATMELKHNRSPLVFFLGAAPSVYFYALFFKNLTDLPIVIVELPNLCYARFQTQMPTVTHTLRAVGDFLKEWNDVPKSHYVAHSLGNVYLAAITNGAAFGVLPPTDKMLFIEPICFLEGFESCFRFPFYSVADIRAVVDDTLLLPSGTPSCVKQLISLIFHYFECRDEHLQEACTRVVTTASQAFVHDVNIEARAIFGKLDFLVPSASIQAHIAEHLPKIDTVEYATGEHAGFLVDAGYREFVHHHMRSYLYPTN